MKILALADRRINNLKEIINNNNIDIIITLGDLGYYDLIDLGEINIPKIGVYGNHCNEGYFDNLGIINLHLNKINLSGLNFGGFEGCVKYKNGDFQYTQEEANEMIKKLPEVDILISHCPPRGINNNDDHAHIGFDSLKEYIDTYKPKAILHGHTYDYGDFITKYNDTDVFYVDGYRIIDLNYETDSNYSKLVNDNFVNYHPDGKHCVCINCRSIHGNIETQLCNVCEYEGY